MVQRRPAEPRLAGDVGLGCRILDYRGRRADGRGKATPLTFKLLDDLVALPERGDGRLVDPAGNQNFQFDLFVFCSPPLSVRREAIMRTAFLAAYQKSEKKGPGSRQENRARVGVEIAIARIEVRRLADHPFLDHQGRCAIPEPLVFAFELPAVGDENNLVTGPAIPLG